MWQHFEEKGENQINAGKWCNTWTLTENKPCPTFTLQQQRQGHTHKPTWSAWEDLTDVDWGFDLWPLAVLLNMAAIVLIGKQKINILVMKRKSVSFLLFLYFWVFVFLSGLFCSLLWRRQSSTFFYLLTWRGRGLREGAVTGQQEVLRVFSFQAGLHFYTMPLNSKGLLVLVNVSGVCPHEGAISQLQRQGRKVNGDSTVRQVINWNIKHMNHIFSVMRFCFCRERNDRKGSLRMERQNTKFWKRTCF